MFRFDNPDALLTLLLVGAAALGVEAPNHPKALRILMVAGALVGSRSSPRCCRRSSCCRRIRSCTSSSRGSKSRDLLHLLAAFGAMLLAAGWWVALVELWPGTRPFIGGSQNDSILELTLGYNGLGRLTGDETGSVGGAGGGGWAEPACCGSSTPRSAGRSPGCCRLAAPARRPASGCVGVPRATACGARSSSGAGGCS